MVLYDAAPLPDAARCLTVTGPVTVVTSRSLYALATGGATDSTTGGATSWRGVSHEVRREVGVPGYDPASRRSVEHLSNRIRRWRRAASQPVSRPPFRLSQLSQMSQFRGYRFEITANCPATVAACRLSQSVTEPVKPALRGPCFRREAKRSKHGDSQPVHFFAFSPSSTSRRNASERLVSFAAAQASTCAINGGGIRAAIWGSLPPFAGRPLRFFFGATIIDFFIITVVP